MTESQFEAKLLKIKKKTEATLQIGINVAQPFSFINFLLFQYGSPPKWQLRNKSHKI